MKSHQNPIKIEWKDDFKPENNNNQFKNERLEFIPIADNKENEEFLKETFKKF